MSEYILTEMLGGDYDNHLVIRSSHLKSSEAKAERKRLIHVRSQRPLFNEFDPKDVKSVESFRKTQETNLEVWKKVI
jgi:hypothetical protein